VIGRGKQSCLPTIAEGLVWGGGGEKFVHPFHTKNEIGWKKLIIHSFQRRGKLVNEK